jgi:hypothetical protein
MTEIAASLSSWTTREHRRFAEIDVVFRSGDLPARLVSARKALAGFVAELRRRMRKTPVDHLDHVYWVSGVQVWTSLKYPDPTEIPVLPPELDVGRRPDRHNILRLILKSLASCYRRPVGHGIPVSEMPSVPIWHHHWLDSKLVLDWLGTMRARTHGRNLLICERGSPLSRTLPRLASFDVGVASDIVAGADEPGETDNAAPDRRYDNVLLHVYRSNVRQTGAILETARARLRPGGTVAVYIEHVNGELDTSNFSSELAQYLDDVLPGDWIGHRLEARFAGGIIKRRIRWCELILLRYVRPASVRMLPHFAIALMLWPVFAALTAVNNFLARNLSSRCPPYCSSALFSLSGIPVPTVANTSRTSNITFNPTARAGIPAALRVEPSPVISDGD